MTTPAATPTTHTVPCMTRNKGKHSGVFLLTNPSHGDHMICSDVACSAEGVRFRWCGICSRPVARRNFKERHGHGIEEPEEATKGGGKKEGESNKGVKRKERAKTTKAAEVKNEGLADLENSDNQMAQNQANNQPNQSYNYSIYSNGSSNNNNYPPNNNSNNNSNSYNNNNNNNNNYNNNNPNNNNNYQNNNNNQQNNQQHNQNYNPPNTTFNYPPPPNFTSSSIIPLLACCFLPQHPSHLPYLENLDPKTYFSKIALDDSICFAVNPILPQSCWIVASNDNFRTTVGYDVSDIRSNSQSPNTLHQNTKIFDLSTLSANETVGVFTKLFVESNGLNAESDVVAFENFKIGTWGDGAKFFKGSGKKCVRNEGVLFLFVLEIGAASKVKENEKVEEEEEEKEGSSSSSSSSASASSNGGSGSESSAVVQNEVMNEVNTNTNTNTNTNATNGSGSDTDTVSVSSQQQQQQQPILKTAQNPNTDSDSGPAIESDPVIDESLASLTSSTTATATATTAAAIDDDDDNKDTSNDAISSIDKGAYQSDADADDDDDDSDDSDDSDEEKESADASASGESDGAGNEF